MSRRNAAVFGLVLLATTVGIVTAASQVPVSGDIALQTNSGLTVTATGVSSLNLSEPFINNETVELKGQNFSASGQSSIVVDESDASGFTNISDISAGPGVIVNRSDAQSATELGSGMTSANVTTISIAQEGNTDFIYSAATDTTVGVESGGQGVLAVDKSSGTALDEARPGPDGITTLDLPQAQSNAVDFQEGPNTLLFRPVENPQQRLSNAGTVNVSFYEREGRSVFTRSTTDGQVSFVGLPKTESFVARADVAGFVERRVLVESVFEQSSIYLLNESAGLVNVSFSIRDSTGQFGSSATLEIQRALNVTGTPDGERRYVNVAGAALGEAREVTTTLEQGVRYRLVVSNRQGQQRQLGSIIPQNDRAFQLEITQLDFSFNQSSGGPVINTTATTSGSGNGTTKTLTVIFDDPGDPGGGWGQIFGVGFLLVLGGVFSVGNARIGALIIPGAALLLYQLGFLTGATSLLGIGLAFSIAVAYNLVQTSGVVLGP